ncbi:MAG: peptidylprolyl isomerase [Sutterella sp.]|nr:peptidylprolyl isomerase [Sutterella sp.]
MTMNTAMAANDPRVEITTNLGKIVVQLDPARAPITTKNFLTYVNEGFYKGTIFHRVIGTFMIQGGGFTEDLKEKPTHAPIPLESRNGLSNDKYTIAMARTSYPHSATSQFFINVADNYFLNASKAQDGYGYAVFGQVVSGTDVVDKIAGVATGSRGFMNDVPTEAVIIQDVRELK